MADSMYSDLIARHYNFTGKLRKAEPDSGLKADSVVFIIVCCLIVLENLLVLVTIWRTKKFHKPTYYFIGNLALSDLLAGVVYTANILLSGANTYRLSPAQWFLREGSMFVALAASVFSLLAIATERHLTMLRMKPHSGGKTCRVFLLISGCWGVAAVLGGLPVLGWNCIEAMPSCSTVLPLYHKTYILFCTTVFSVILLAIVALYARVYALVRTRSRQMLSHQAPDGGAGGRGGVGGRSSERSLALLRTVIVVLSCFIACWAPLFLLLLLDVACETRQCAILYKAEWFLALAVLNSAMNPLLYTLTSTEMRQAFLRVLTGGGACRFQRPALKAKPPFFAAEFTRSRSGDSSHPNREEAESSPRETAGSFGNVVSSASS
ncbi:sphingosine 1-phosphate receptor 1-like [Anguilla anguilla]|uniref:sphingosine 1-phosphate receptor 1-like n=1 Tax=Anguilla anguilla TaxID=7936 RepID=UPI0015A761C7|nr:sphingosine 1-phosphate receptor 1-like [Anguilla anguilla]XP_035276361.1 sphingosine 1-phosphate receptor 1-like [Anguilla anguilla]